MSAQRSPSSAPASGSRVLSTARSRLIASAQSERDRSSRSLGERAVRAARPSGSPVDSHASRLEIAAIFLAVAWILGWSAGYTVGGLIHAVPIVAAALVAARMRRRVAQK